MNKNLYLKLQEQLDYSNVASYARLTISAAQSIPNNTATAVVWDVTSSDTEGLIGTDNTTDLRINKAGVYLITMNTEFAASATGDRETKILKNATENIGIERLRTSTLIYRSTLNTRVQEMFPGDTIRAEVLQNSGGALDLLVGGTFLSIVRVGEAFND